MQVCKEPFAPRLLSPERELLKSARQYQVTFPPWAAYFLLVQMTINELAWLHIYPVPCHIINKSSRLPRRSAPFGVALSSPRYLSTYLPVGTLLPYLPPYISTLHGDYRRELGKVSRYVGTYMLSARIVRIPGNTNSAWYLILCTVPLAWHGYKKKTEK